MAPHENKRANSSRCKNGAKGQSGHQRHHVTQEFDNICRLWIVTRKIPCHLLLVSLYCLRGRCPVWHGRFLTSRLYIVQRLPSLAHIHDRCKRMRPKYWMHACTTNSHLFVKNKQLYYPRSQPSSAASIEVILFLYRSGNSRSSKSLSKTRYISWIVLTHSTRTLLVGSIVP